MIICQQADILVLVLQQLRRPASERNQGLVKELRSSVKTLGNFGSTSRRAPGLLLFAACNQWQQQRSTTANNPPHPEKTKRCTVAPNKGQVVKIGAVPGLVLKSRLHRFMPFSARRFVVAGRLAAWRRIKNQALRGKKVNR